MRPVRVVNRTRRGETAGRGSARIPTALPPFSSQCSRLLGASPAAADAGCPGTQVPPPPAAVEETAPGVVVPAPLPWPLVPVGGAALGACGDVLAPGDPALPPEVTAGGFVLADLDTGAVLAARAPHARQRPASTLKVLTAMVAIDRLDPDAQVAGTPEDLSIHGSRAGIGPAARTRSGNC